MTKINIQDVAYTAYQVPDLELMEKFLLDFGMTRSARTDNSLFMRGSGANHHIHVFTVADNANRRAAIRRNTANFT